MVGYYDLPFSIWLLKRRRTVLWILANFVAYRLQQRHKLTCHDYYDSKGLGMLTLTVEHNYICFHYRSLELHLKYTPHHTAKSYSQKNDQPQLSSICTPPPLR